MIDTAKVCNKCGELRPLSEFHINKNGRLGRQAKCKSCTNSLYYRPRKTEIIAATRKRRLDPSIKSRERVWQRNRRRSNPLTRILQEAKWRATKRGIAFSITAGDVSIPEICPVLGIPIGMSVGGRSDGSPSIDRIDTRKGYIPGNVLIVSWRANRLKSDATLGEMRAIVAYMESRQ